MSAYSFTITNECQDAYNAERGNWGEPYQYLSKSKAEIRELIGAARASDPTAGIAMLSAPSHEIYDRSDLIEVELYRTDGGREYVASILCGVEHVAEIAYSTTIERALHPFRALKITHKGHQHWVRHGPALSCAMTTCPFERLGTKRPEVRHMFGRNPIFE